MGHDDLMPRRCQLSHLIHRLLGDRHLLLVRAFLSHRNDGVATERNNESFVIGHLLHRFP